MPKLEIIFIVGLPCSGKSTLGKKLIQDGGTLIDDVTVNGGLANFNNLSSYISSPLVIIDPYLCLKESQEFAANFFKKFHTLFKLKLSWIFFENSPEKCLANLRRRWYNGDTRQVEGSIHYFSKNYFIPANCDLRKVYSGT